MKKILLKRIIITCLVILSLAFFMSGSVSADQNKENKNELNAVNINVASVTEIMAIPGIGRKKAEAIVAYRDKNGGFGSIEELQRIDGIGKKTLEKIKEYIRTD